MAYESKSIDQVLLDFPKCEIEIIFVGDFKIKKHPFYYRVILKAVSPKGITYYPVAEVTPEDLHSKYVIGYKYNGIDFIGLGDEINVGKFDIIDGHLLKRMKISDIVENNGLDSFITRSQTEQYYLDQYCYVIEYEDYNLIIPHYAIANHFHFKSSQLKDAVLDNTFDSLYYQKTFKRIDNETVFLKIKTKINMGNLDTVCDFLDDQNTARCFDSFKYYLDQRSQCNSRDEQVQIETIFPYEKDFSIKGTCRELSGKGKKFILLLGIYEDSIKYNFKHIQYQIDSSPTIYTEPVDGKTTKENPLSTGMTVTKVPSSKNMRKNTTFFQKEFNNKKDVTLEGEYLKEPKEEPLHKIDTDDFADESFEKGSTKGSKKVRGINRVTEYEEKKKVKVSFEFEDFKKLLNLIENNDKYIISNLEKSESIEFKKIKTKKGNIVYRSYLEDKVTLRQFMYGSFQYKKMIISFLAIQNDAKWDRVSTWFFISDTPIISEEFAHERLNDYLGKKKVLKKIKKEMLAKGIIFFIKELPQNFDEKSLKGWLDTLFSSIKKFIS